MKCITKWGLGTFLFYHTQYSTIWLRGQERITYRSTINRGYRPDRASLRALAGGQVCSMNRGPTTMKRLWEGSKRLMVVALLAGAMPLLEHVNVSHYLTLPVIHDGGSWFIEGACPMNTATHTVEVPFPQAPASPKRNLFPCAPRYSRNRVPPVERHHLAVRQECALLRDLTLISFPVSWQTRSCFYRWPCASEPTETRLSCQGARGMIAQNRTNATKRELLPAGSASFNRLYESQELSDAISVTNQANSASPH